MKNKKARADVATDALDARDIDLMIAAIGATRRKLAVVQIALDVDIAATKKIWEKKAAPAKANIEAAERTVEAWCDAHRKELCPGESKTYHFPSGDVSWRDRPASVSVKGKVERLIDWLREHGPAKFLREKTELNKEAMLDDTAAAAKIPGVTIRSSGETFSIDPIDAKLSEGM